MRQFPRHVVPSLLLIALWSVAASSVAAPLQTRVFKCVVAGRTAYQDTPCPGAAAAKDMTAAMTKAGAQPVLPAAKAIAAEAHAPEEQAAASTIVQK